MTPPGRRLEAQLADTRSRLEALWTDPAALRRRASWIERAWIRMTGAGAQLTADRLRAFSTDTGRSVDARWAEHSSMIIDELSDNIRHLERAATREGTVPASTLTWLFGVHRWIESMQRASAGRRSQSQYALTRGVASRALLTMANAGLPGETVALAGVDALLDEAAQEVERLSRRRRLLQAARRILIDAEAGAEGGPAWAERREMIAEELTQLRRIEAAGLHPEVDVSQQLQEALRRSKPHDTLRVCAALTYLAADAPRRSAGAGRLHAAIVRVASVLPSVPHSSDSLLPASVQEAVREGYSVARERNQGALETASLSEAGARRRRGRHLAVDAHLSLLRMALGIDGVFDVGGALESHATESVAPTARSVPFPTAELEMRRLTDPTRVQHAVIEDPRLLIYHLASRRLLERRFVARGVEQGRRRSVMASIRFYLLDGSSSMQGPRARMRDAILVAELATLVSRLERPSGDVRSLLFYRYFNSTAEITRRVALIPEALEAIEQVLGAERSGGTNIEGALVDSLELIERQRDNDVAFSKAQIVLVTDGEAPFDPELIIDAQRRLAVPVRVSVIALGGQNLGLRAFAAQQRNAGLRVLYQHVADAALDRWETGADQRAWPGFDAQALDEAALASAPRMALEELASLSRAPSGAAHDLPTMLAAMKEVGLDATDLDEGARAKMEARARDTRSLSRRFDRLFPTPTAAPSAVVDSADTELTFVIDALSIVLEVLTLSPADPDTGRADAIAILERLLRARGLPPRRYLELVRAHPGAAGVGILAIRSACGERPAR